MHTLLSVYHLGLTNFASYQLMKKLLVSMSALAVGNLLVIK